MIISHLDCRNRFYSPLCYKPWCSDLIPVSESFSVSNPRSVGPSGASVSSQSPMTVTVTWTPSARTCDILAYIVGYIGMNGESGQVTVSGGDSTFAILTGLTPDTRYSVFIDTLTHTYGNLGNSAGYQVTTMAGRLPVNPFILFWR